MALTPGNSISPNTKLGDCPDVVFPNRSANLASKDAEFTVVEPTVLMACWPKTGQGDNLVYIRFSARPVAPEVIGV